MQTVTLDRPREEAGAIVRAAFKQTDAIRLYHVGENRATGKTGVRRVCWGERVVVEFAETREGGIEFTVRAEKEVRENVTADPEAVESAVLNQLVRADPEQDTTPTSEDSGEDTVGAGGSTDTREVPHPEDLPSGRRAAVLFLGLFVPLLSASAVLLGTRTVRAIASGSFTRLLLSLGGFLLVAVLIGAVGMLVTWHDEGTLRQRLPV